MTRNSGLLLYLTALFVLLEYVKADCSVSFFAKNIKYEDAVEIDFYYTGINLFSVKECASFCAQREFCRSAVYNTRTKTCGISYEYTLSCAANLGRFDNFESESTSDLIQIACIDECTPDKLKEKSIGKRPIGIITGEPNNGEPKQVARDAINSNVITDPLASTEPEIKRERANGYVTRLILANITGLENGGVGTVEPLALPQKDDKIGRQSKKGKSQICYRTIRHRYLLGANFEEHDVSSINECRCMCAATYKDNKGMHRCQSFQYKNGKCTLNKGNHLGHFDLIEGRKMVYQYVDCDINVLLDVASNFCPNFKKSTMMATTTAKPTTPKKKIELVTAKSIPPKPKSKEATSQKPKPQSTTAKPVTKTTTTVKPTPKTTKATTKSTKTIPTTTTTTTTTPTTTTTTTETPTTTTEQSTKTPEVTEKPQKKDRPTGNDVGEEHPEEPIITKKDECFEIIDDHLMVSVAGGLEHDVSIEECQCICANSKKSGKYEFQCRSATYYHVEKDCILNLEDRFMKSKLFEKQFVNFNVSYVGITCPVEKAIELRSELGSTQCKRAEPTTTEAPKKKKNGANSDECYVELSDFVLEGTAIAVESGVSPQECKCKCAEGEKLYGEECASFLYYYDSKTCLINKQNRFSNPEKFNFVPSVNQSRSYFEWKCANKDDSRSSYLSNVCSVKIQEVEGNLLNSEGDTVEVKQDKQQIAEEKEVRMKRLDEKDFLTRIEEVVEETKLKEQNDIDTKKKELLKKLASLEEKNSESTTPETTTTTETKLSELEETSTSPAKKDKKIVNTKVVSEKSIMERISEAEKKLSESNNDNEEIEEATTPRLIINKKKRKEQKEKKELATAEIAQKNGTVSTRNVSDLEMEKLLNKKVTERTDSITDGEEVKDANRINMKKVEEKVLEKISKMEVQEVSIPEAEGPEEQFKEVTPPSKPAHTSVTSKKKKKEKYIIPEAEGIDDESSGNAKETLSPELDEEPTTVDLRTTSENPKDDAKKTTTKAKAGGVKTHKFDEKVDKGLPLPQISTTTPTTTTTAGYPSAGRCSYSALYQTTFLGRRLLKTVRVKSPSDCFAACYALRCRSANLIAQGELHSCELYKDSLIDYRRPDMIGYDAATVYFDGINCDGTQ